MKAKVCLCLRHDDYDLFYKMTEIHVRANINYVIASEVKQHACLYNCFSLEYKSKLCRKRAWEAISTKLKLDEKTIRTKWKTIRDTYMKQRKGQRTTKGVFSKTGQLYKSLSFLDDCMEDGDADDTVISNNGTSGLNRPLKKSDSRVITKLGRRTTPFILPKPPQTAVPTFMSTLTTFPEVKTEFICNNSSDNLMKGNPLADDSFTSWNDSLSSSSDQQKKENDPLDQEDDPAIKKLTDSETIRLQRALLQKLTSEEVCDPIKTFLLSQLGPLKAMSEEGRQKVMLEIHQLMYENRNS